MIDYLLDTNIVIYTMKNRPAAVRDRFSYHYGAMAVSTVTLMELYYGAERSMKPVENRALVDGFCARLEVLPYDPKAALHTAQIRAELASTGSTIGSYDSMIAGHARANGFILVTRNIAEFTRVPGLRVENWA